MDGGQALGRGESDDARKIQFGELIAERRWNGNPPLAVHLVDDMAGE